MAYRPRGGSWQVDVKVNGQRVRETAADEAEAKVLESEIRTCLLKGQTWVRATSGSSIRTLQDAFEAARKTHWDGTKAESKTWLNARLVMALLGADHALDKIDTDVIEGMVATLKLQGNANGTINRKLAALSKALTEAFDRGWIKKKPKITRRREGQGRTRFLSFEEEAELLAYFRHVGQDIMADLCEVLIDTGMRVSEAMRAEINDLSADGKALTVWVNKSDKPRTIPLTSRVATLLAIRKYGSPDHYQPRKGRLFHGICQRQVNYQWDRARTHMGLDDDKQFVPHALRHTFCSRLVQRGVPILTVKELAGHKVLEVTMRYAHLAPQNLRSAIDMLEPINP